jgi:phage-related protein
MVFPVDYELSNSQNIQHATVPGRTVAATLLAWGEVRGRDRYNIGSQ